MSAPSPSPAPAPGAPNDPTSTTPTTPATPPTHPAAPLQAALLERFTRAFGPPHKVAGHGTQWSLRALAYVAAINVYIDGNSGTPQVWIFDPHDPTDGVRSEKITDRAHIDPLIAQITERVRTAGRSRPS